MRFSGDPDPPSLLVRASTIRSLTDQPDEPAAFVVRNGRIKQVLQTNEQAQEMAEKNHTSCIDRPKHCVLPSFGDAHTHLKWLGESMLEPDLSSCSSYEEIRSKLTEWIKTHSLSRGELLHGRGWNPNHVNENRWPHRSDLDHPLLSKHPIALLSHDHHAYWVNDTFLNELPRNYVSTPAPDGKIKTDEQGNPTGVFLESAIEPVSDVVEQKQNKRETSSLILSALEELVRNGITCAHDFGKADSLLAHQNLRSSFDLLPQVCFFCFQGNWDQIPSALCSPGTISNGLEFAGMKLFADGTLSAQTAALLEPYQKDMNDGLSRGEMVTNSETLKQRAQKAARNGFSTSIHAIGDRAVRTGLNVLSEVYDASDPPDYPPRIEHAQLISPPDHARFAKHGIIPSMQPCHRFQDQPVAERVLGKRSDEMFPLKTLTNKGATLMFGSDTPIEPPNPFRNLQSAVGNRRNEPSSCSDDSISVEQALRFSCKTPHTYLNCSRNRGKITTGTPANFVVVSNDPFSIPSDSLTDLHVLETYIHGQRVHPS